MHMESMLKVSYMPLFRSPQAESYWDMDDNEFIHYVFQGLESGMRKFYEGEGHDSLSAIRMAEITARSVRQIRGQEMIERLAAIAPDSEFYKSACDARSFIDPDHEITPDPRFVMPRRFVLKEDGEAYNSAKMAELELKEWDLKFDGGELNHHARL